MLKQTGFLLSYLKYGDHDAVLHFYTLEKGFQSFFSRGIYAPKNRKRAYLMPLNELILTLPPHQKSGKLILVSKFEPTENPDFYSDVRCSAIVFFVSDFLNQVLRQENNSEDIYSEILNFLDELEKKNYQSHLILLYNILALLGFKPLKSENLFLDPESGNFQNEPTHSLFSSEISQIWKNLDSRENYNIKIRGDLRRPFLESLMTYCQFHLSGFRIPHSLEIVQQIFE